MGLAINDLENDMDLEFNFKATIYKSMFTYEFITMQTLNDIVKTKRVSLTPANALASNHNHRKININELVYDIDCHEDSISHEVWQKISDNLVQADISHSVWDTSRSYHIHVLFEDLFMFPYEVRNDIRKFLLQKYSKPYNHWIDMQLALESHMIRAFGSVHELTGKPKTLIYVYPDINSHLNRITAINLNDFWERYKALNSGINVKNLGCNKVEGVLEQTYETLKLQKFLDFCCRTTMHKQGMLKHMKLFKNIAIACFILGFNEERKRIFKEVIGNCRGHKVSELEGWYKWCCSRNRRLKVSWKEVQIYYGNNI